MTKKKSADEQLEELKVTYAHGHDGSGYIVRCHKTGVEGRSTFAEGEEAAKLDLIANLTAK